MNENQIAVKIHAPNIEPTIRHPKILETFDELQSGQYMELTNDHDPKPLQYQFMMEREGTFTWDYVENGPFVWKVIIGKK